MVVRHENIEIYIGPNFAERVTLNNEGFIIHSHCGLLSSSQILLNEKREFVSYSFILSVVLSLLWSLKL